MTGWSIEPDADLSASADEHQVAEEPSTAPADEDEEAAQLSDTAPDVEVTVYDENLQVGEGSAGPRDYDDYVILGRLIAKGCSALCSAMRARLPCTVMVRAEHSSAEHGTDRRGRSP